MNEEVLSKTTAALQFIPISKLFANGLLALFLILAIFAFYKIAVSWISKNIEDNEQRYKARKRIRGLSFVIFILLALSIWSSQLRNLSVFLGFAGAGIAFALKEVIIGVAGWFVIVTGKFYSPGDRVQLAGVFGDVLDIGILRTTIMECGQWVNGDQYNGRIVRISNNFVFKGPVFNYSSEFPFVWDELSIPVKTNSNQNLAKQIISAAGIEVVGDYAQSVSSSWKTLPRKYRIEDVNLDPQVYMSFDSNWVTYVLRYVVDYRQRRNTKNILYTKILSEIAKNREEVQVAIAAQEIFYGDPNRSIP